MVNGGPSGNNFLLWAARLAAVFLLVAPSLAVPAAAAPAGPDRVRAELEVVLDSPAGGRFDGNFSFFIYTLNGTTAPADAIRDSILAPEGYNVRAYLESHARSMFTDHFQGLFPNDTLTSVVCLLDNSSLVDVPGTDAQHPPVVIRARGTVRVDPGSYGLPETADLDALVPLVLGDGAELHRDLPLSALPGHSIGLALSSFPGSVFDGTGTASFALSLDNEGGTQPVSRSFGVGLRSRSPAPPGADSLSVRGTVDLPDLSTVRIIGSVEFRRANLSGYWTPPAGVRNLTSVSGATLSELVRSGTLPEQDIYEYGVLPVQAGLQARLASILNVTLVFVPSWSAAGNLTCALSASSANRPLFGLSNALILGALRAGASFRLAIPVEIGWPVELEFLLPAGLRLDGLTEATLPSGRPRFLWSSPGGWGNISALLRSDLAPPPGGDMVSITVLADFSTPRLELGELLLKGSTVVPVSVDLRIRMGVVAVPRSMSGFIPENLTLASLTADLLRLLLAERVFTSVEMDSLLREVRPRLEGPMRAALGRGVQPNIRYVRQSLEGYDLNRMDGSRPVEIQAWASGERTKHLDLFRVVRCSPGLLSITQDFSFGGVTGWNVTYRMRFSEETKLVSIRQDGKRAVRGTDGGRDYFEVSFGKEGGWTNVTATLEPTPGLLLRSLGPVCIPTLLLFIVAVVLIIRRVRRRRRLRAGARLVTWDSPEIGKI